MFKKLIVLLVTAAGAAAVKKKMRDMEAEQHLWAEATDEVTPQH